MNNFIFFFNLKTSLFDRILKKNLISEFIILANLELFDFQITANENILDKVYITSLTGRVIGIIHSVGCKGLFEASRHWSRILGRFGMRCAALSPE